MLSRVLTVLTTLAVLVASGSITGSGAASAAPADNNLTGYGFDACTAPDQETMDAWWETSPYAAVGVYIGGSNRLCDQPELDRRWVKKQRRTGWLVLPLWVGPQAACSGYGDVMSSDRGTAEKQGRAEAGKAVAAAKGLGIARGATLYYDLEDYDLGPDDCRQPALAFLSGWTKSVRAKGYRSGVYSNVAAAITSLDYAQQVSRGSYAMPDVIWFAWDNGRADTADGGWVDTSTWDGHRRIHQYDLDTEQTHGGVTLDIDKNWVDVGQGSVGSPSKNLCRGVSVDLRAYPRLTRGRRGPAVEAAQCLLRVGGYTKAPVTGRYDARTAAGVEKAQRRLGLKRTGKVDRRTWTALLARGADPVLKVGSTGDAVRRLQRALTAALAKRVVVDGAFSTRTAKAVTTYQRRAGLPRTGVVTGELWSLLQRGLP
jgi:hypothetical protein